MAEPPPFLGRSVAKYFSSLTFPEYLYSLAFSFASRVSSVSSAVISMSPTWAANHGTIFLSNASMGTNGCFLSISPSLPFFAFLYSGLMSYSLRRTLCWPYFSRAAFPQRIRNAILSFRVGMFLAHCTMAANHFPVPILVVNKGVKIFSPKLFRWTI